MNDRVWAGNESEEYRSCLIKTRFDKRKHAMEAATDMRVRKGIATLVPYHCRYCKGWHLGNPRVKRRANDDIGQNPPFEQEDGAR